jgi:hypothetical protein
VGCLVVGCFENPRSIRLRSYVQAKSWSFQAESLGTMSRVLIWNVGVPTPICKFPCWRALIWRTRFVTLGTETLPITSHLLKWTSQQASYVAIPRPVRASRTGGGELS